MPNRPTQGEQDNAERPHSTTEPAENHRGSIADQSNSETEQNENRTETLATKHREQEWAKRREPGDQKAE